MRVQVQGCLTDSNDEGNRLNVLENLVLICHISALEVFLRIQKTDFIDLTENLIPAQQGLNKHKPSALSK